MMMWTTLDLRGNNVAKEKRTGWLCDERGWKSYREETDKRLPYAAVLEKRDVDEAYDEWMKIQQKSMKKCFKKKTIGNGGKIKNTNIENLLDQKKNKKNELTRILE